MQFCRRGACYPQSGMDAPGRPAHRGQTRSKGNHLRALLILLASLLIATPALAQRNADEEDSMILGASTAMEDAYRTSDTFAGDDHCRALRDMLHNLRFHSSERYSGAMAMVERRCGEWEQPAPRAAAASAPVRTRPAEFGPASLTHDQSEIWMLVVRADEWAVQGTPLPRGAERDAKFSEARFVCHTAHQLAPKVGPDAEALTLACLGRGNVLLREKGGCDQLRNALAGFAALGDNSIYAEQIGRYRAIAQTLTTTGLCIGVIEPPTLEEEEQRIKDALDRAMGLIPEILALPEGSSGYVAKVKQMGALCSGVFGMAFGNEHGAGTLVATCGGYAKFLGNDPKGCDIIRKTYGALDLPEIRNGPFGKRASEYRERSAQVLSQGCKVH